MENKIILKDYSLEDAEKTAKNIVLENDEYFVVKEISKPFKLLFIKFKGVYEVSILKKEKKSDKIIEKNKEIKEKINKKNDEKDNKFENIDKLIETHFKLSKLDIKIVNRKIKENIIIYYLDGKDLLNFSKAKGLANLSKMISITNPKLRKKVELLSNYDIKRNEIKIRKLARNVAKKVIETKESKDLFGFDPSKRRIIHEELSSFKNIKTKSYGEGKDRYIRIMFVENKKES